MPEPDYEFDDAVTGTFAEQRAADPDVEAGDTPDDE